MLPVTLSADTRKPARLRIVASALSLPLYIALQRVGVGKGQARKEVEKAIARLKLFAIVPTANTLKHWEERMEPPLTELDEEVIATAIDNCERDPQRLIEYFIGFGIRTNLSLQRIMNSEGYQNIFGRIQIGQQGWHCNTGLIEFADYAGSFRNTTVAGQINGLELHLGVVDDPVKGRAEGQ